MSRRKSALLWTCLLLASAPACRAAAGAEKAPATEARTLSVSLDGSADRYGDSSSDELRAGLEMECASELKLGRSALNWDLELYYDYSRNRSDGSSTRANSAGLDLAKIMLSRWRGAELKFFKPYLLAGAELTWLREHDEEEAAASSRFLAPTLGAGVELKLSRRVAMNAEYRSNLCGGDRRVAGMSLGLNYAVFGGDEDEKDGKDAD